MKKPPQALLALIDLGRIRGIIIDYKQTGNDTAETFCEILGYENRKVCGLWRTYSSYLDVKVDWSSIARIQPQFAKQASDWEAFELANQTELAEYNRLKAKFEGGAA